jgi:hypothetical protein
MLKIKTFFANYQTLEIEYTKAVNELIMKTPKYKKLKIKELVQIDGSQWYCIHYKYKWIKSEED